MQVSRRKFVATTLGATSVGGIGAALTNSNGYSASAASVSGDFTILEVDRKIQNPVNSFRLNVSGSAGWQAETVPSKAFVRLEVSRSGAFQQLDSHVFSGLSRDYQSEFAFQDVNLLSHERIQVASVNPTELGETQSLDLRARLTLVVKKNGTTLATDELTTNIPVSVEKTAGSVDVSMGASGEVVIGEKDG